MIRLGSLTINQMEERTGITFSEELKNFLKEESKNFKQPLQISINTQN